MTTPKSPKRLNIKIFPQMSLVDSAEVVSSKMAVAIIWKRNESKIEPKAIKIERFALLGV